MSELIGYARVSRHDQDLQLQTDALNAAGVDRQFSDTASSTVTQRPGLALALGHLRAGDTLVVWKLDRLGRQLRGMLDLFAQLEKSDIKFRSLTEGIDTGTPIGRFFFHVTASFAQMERELIVERTRAGLVAARARGRFGGRRRALSEKKIKAALTFFEAGMPSKEIADTLGCSVPTLYRYIPASTRQLALIGEIIGAGGCDYPNCACPHEGTEIRCRTGSTLVASRPPAGAGSLPQSE